MAEAPRARCTKCGRVIEVQRLHEDPHRCPESPDETGMVDGRVNRFGDVLDRLNDQPTESQAGLVPVRAFRQMLDFTRQMRIETKAFTAMCGCSPACDRCRPLLVMADLIVDQAREVSTCAAEHQVRPGYVDPNPRPRLEP